MRIYRTDGSYDDYPNDTEFGWYFNEILVDENDFNNEEVNKEKVMESPAKTSLEESFMESVDILGYAPIKTPIIVKKIDPHITIQPVVNVVDCKMDIEGPLPVNKHEINLQNIDSTVPPKEQLANLINPCNYETKMLMSIVCFAKYKSLMKQENAEELFKSVNYRTTNFRYLIRENNVSEEIYKEIQNYHATKEENMLSLMMELILTDMKCNLEDLVDVNEPQRVKKKNIHPLVFETSDLGNSIQSSCSGRGETKTNYMSATDRSSILSSIGLSEEDESIQSFCDEIIEMHSQIEEIKNSFREEEDRVNNLIKMAMDLEKELKETLYLNDILHLLKGDIEKVKLKKLPFRIFHKGKEEGSELNLIV